MADKTSLFLVTAFTTDEGYPVYLRADGSWSRDIQEAGPVPEDQSTALVKEREDNDQRQVCDPYAFKVEVRDGKIDPLSVRETIRSQGPTTPLRRPD